MSGLHLTFMQKYYKKLRGKRNENFSKKGKTMTNTLSTVNGYLSVLPVPAEARLVTALLIGVALALLLVHLWHLHIHKPRRAKRAASLIEHLLSTDNKELRLNHLYHDPRERNLKATQGGDTVEIVHPANTSSTNPAALAFAGFERHEVKDGMGVVENKLGYETVSWVTKEGGGRHKLLRRRRERDVKEGTKQPSERAVAPAG